MLYARAAPLLSTIVTTVHIKLAINSYAEDKGPLNRKIKEGFKFLCGQCTFALFCFVGFPFIPAALTSSSNNVTSLKKIEAMII